MVQFSSGYVIVVTLVIQCIVENESAPYEQSEYVTKVDKVRVKFGNLLGSIADVNEQRMKALKKYNDLDGYNAASGALRHADPKDPIVVFLLPNKNPKVTDNFYDKYESYDKGLAKTPAHKHLQLINEHNKDYETSADILRNKLRKNVEKQNKDLIEETLHMTGTEEESDGKEINNGKEQLKLIKDTSSKVDSKQVLRIWKSCSKKAAKKCKKSCKAAYKNTCKSYKCSKSMKKAFKKNCNSECKDNFSN